MAMIVDFAYKTKSKNLDVDKLGGIEYFSTDPIADLWPGQMRIQLLSKKKPEDYFPVGSLRLVSTRFKSVCRDFKVNAEFLPVQLMEKDGTQSKQQFYVCHLLENVDCFDFENSKCEFRDKKQKWLDEVIELVLDEEKTQGHHLFRVAVSLFIIAASEEFAETVQRLRLSGAVFVESRKWRGVST